jgi:replicative DNA helicase
MDATSPESIESAATQPEAGSSAAAAPPALPVATDAPPAAPPTSMFAPVPATATAAPAPVATPSTAAAHAAIPAIAPTAPPAARPAQGPGPTFAPPPGYPGGPGPRPPQPPQGPFGPPFAPPGPPPPRPGLFVPPAPALAPLPNMPAPAAPMQAEWSIDSGVGIVQPRPATEVLATLAGKVSRGDVDQYQPVPLGFTPLDKTIGGGLRAGELLLIGGAQGTGKTTMALQMARNVVMGGQASVLYICFEHDEEYLLNRIIAMESVLQNLPNTGSGVKLVDVRREILGTWLAHGGQNADLASNPRLRPALERMARYGPNLFLMRGSQTTSTVENIHQLVERYKQISGDRRLVVVVDYMQKVPVIPDPPTETEKVTIIVNGLKDLALSLEVPMISIVAADKEGLKASRLRNHHLRGSSAINYEADIILILNEKYQIVAKVNIEFNPYQAQRFRDWVITTVEKNRGGTNSVDLEFQKHFEFSCFDPAGRTVMEKLIEERLYND